MLLLVAIAVILAATAFAESTHPPSDVIIGVPPRIPFNAPFQWGYSLNQSNNNLLRFDYTLARLIAPSGESPSQQPNGTLARMFPDRIDRKSTPYEFKLPPGTQSQSSYRSSSSSSGSSGSSKRDLDLPNDAALLPRSSSIYTLDSHHNDTSTPLCTLTSNTSTPSYYEWHNATEPGHWTVEVQSVILYGSDGYEERGNETCISPPFTYERMRAKVEFSVSTLDIDEIENDEEESEENSDGDTNDTNSNTISTSSTSTYTPQTSASATKVTVTFSPSPTGNIMVSGAVSRNTIARTSLVLSVMATLYLVLLKQL
ncbi:hypothetical protein E3P99_01909 [Wallemia hederae]|uniref:Ig-like domain-containing protein n=1 Tax=Wallemia hederae TaxID=1540922 RepID=A0A4T0FME4_9BASI|nr:hypothetical protein E3P99_01909 [Wallemia hederae]